MAGNRSIITLECKTCKERNYTTTKNKKKSVKTRRLQMRLKKIAILMT